MKKLSSKVRSAGRRLLGLNSAASDGSGMVTRAGSSPAASLAMAAGREVSSGSMIEALEKRELMFNLTVDANDPSFVADPARPGFGTVTRVFAYFAPVLTNQLPNITQAQGQGLQEPTPPAVPTPDQIEQWREQAGFAAFGGPGGDQPWLSADQIPVDFPQVSRNRMATYLESRIAGALITLYGPLDVDPNTPGAQGASVRVVDLYGRPMVPTLAIGRISPLAAGPDAANIFDNLDGAEAGTVNIGTGNKGPFGAVPHNLVDPTALEAFGDLGADAYTFDADGNFVEAAFPTLQTALRAGQGTSPGSWLAFVNDPTAGDGVPDINDGIGGVIVTRGDGTTRISLNGGQVTRLTEAPTGTNEFDVFDLFGGFGGDFDAGFTTGYALTFAEDFAGTLPGILQRSGYGFALLPGQAQPTPTGFPGAGGSVLIGAHFVRNNGSSSAYYNANFDANAVTPVGGAQQIFVSIPGPQFPVLQGPSFTTIPLPSQVTINGQTITINNAAGQPAVLQMGIGTLPGTNISLDSIVVNGTVLGQYTVSGSLGRFAVTHMLGSLSVTGDLGDMYVGGRGGFWNRADQLGTATALDVLNSTGSVVNVGGSAGRISVAGRSLMQILIQGDTATPRPRVDYVQYTEREELYNGQVYGFNPFALGDLNPVRLFNTLWSLGQTDGAAPQPIFYGGGNYRNDLLTSAEFIGSGVRGAVITGDIGVIDMFEALDSTDSYAFAGEAGQRITLDVAITNPAQNAGRTYVRVFNSQKELIAATRNAGDARATQIPGGQRISFTVPTSGVYYFVISTEDDGQFATELGYQITLTGQAAVTLGQASFGGGGRASFIQVANGAVGQIAFARQIVDIAGGAYVRPGTTQSVDASGIPIADYYRTGAGGTPTIDVRGDLYDLTASGDVQNIILTVGRDLGQFTVGGLDAGGQVTDDLAPVANPFGSLVNATVNVGGQVGRIEVVRSTGYNDFAWIGRAQGTEGGNFSLNTGLAFNTTFRPGHVGGIIFNDSVVGGTLNIVLSDNARIDLMEVRDDRAYDNPNRTGFLNSQPSIIRGQGADVRFLRFLNTALTNPGQTPIGNFFLPLVPGVNTFTDDSGVTFTIELSGPLSFGRVRAIPVGTGFAIGRIEINLPDPRGSVTIRTNAPGSLALGEIAIVGSPTPDRPQLVRFAGISEIDVRSIVFDGVLNIENTTPGGDIVSIQSSTGLIDRVTVTQGNIGAANTFALGQRDLAPRLTDAQFFAMYRAGTINGAPGELAPWRYVNSPGGGLLLEDSGYVADRVLNGLFVPAVNQVTSSGSVGDVIAFGQGVGSVIANSDRSVVPGVFDGIVGTIYGTVIVSVDVGDGLIEIGDSPFAVGGIFACAIDGDPDTGLLGGIASSRINGATIRGAIITSSSIGEIDLRNASIIGATIAVSNLDSFWQTGRYAGTGEDARGARGPIDNITVQGGSIINSDLFANNFRNVSIRGGGWDATSLESSGGIGAIRADFFRSTLTNRPSTEFVFNQIRARDNIASISVNNTRQGDISDLIVSTGGFLTGSISARNIIRSNFDLRAGANTITATNDIRATFIGSSRLQNVSAGGDIRTSSIITTGAILAIRATGEITDTQITSTGPDGRVNSVTASGQITGAITTSGPIGTISNRTGDIVLAIRQTDPIDATITRIAAGRDLVLSLDLAPGANVGTLQAGRHVGRILPDGTQPDALDITGNLGTIRATGVIYSDVRVGGTIGSLTMGRPLGQLIGADFASTAQIIAANRINSISIDGDFDGSIISYSNGIGSVSIRNGSFRQGPANAPNQIAAYAGDIGTVTITKGHLLGNVIAYDGSINTISVTGDQIFGNIGYNPTLSPATRTNVLIAENRGQLPPDSPFAGGIVGTAGRDGPTIRAALDIRSIRTTGGVYESSISAGRAINSVSIGGGIDHLGTGASADDATFIVAGDSLGTVTVRSLARGTVFGAGFASLGADNVVGGADNTANADVLRQGTVRAITLSGGSENVLVIGGVSAGNDGIFANPVTGVDPGNDNRGAPGASTVGSVTVRGTASNTWVLAESGTPRLSTNLAGRVVRESQPAAQFVTAGNPGVVIERTRLVTTVGTGGPAITIQHSGPGRAFYDAATRQLTLVGTTTSSSIRITPGAGVASISGLTIVGGDDVALGTLDIGVDAVNLDVRVDGEIRTLRTRNTNWTAGNDGLAIRAGAGFSSITMGFANQNSDLRIVTPGNVGTFRALGSILIGVNVTSRLQALNINSVNVSGNFGGLISSDRDIRSATITGEMTFNSALRAALNIGSVSVAAMDGAFVSAGGDLNSVNVRGTVDQSSIYAGVDLGSDGRLGGTGAAADRTSSGDLRTVSVGGNFTRSNIAAGVYAAGDGFIGSLDDRTGDGRSVLGNVTIRGSATGSAFNSESFGFRSSGTLGNIRVQNRPFANVGNLTSGAIAKTPAPVVVEDLILGELGGQYTLTVNFNQSVDPATVLPRFDAGNGNLLFAGAFGFSEIRGSEPIGQFFNLVPGADYTVRLSPDNQQVIFTFSQAITSRALQVGGILQNAASPGLYRVTIDASILRGQSDNARLDGDRDGIVELGDNFSADTIIGDAGDRYGVFQPQDGGGNNINFYGPINLDVLLSPNNGTPNAPTINQTATIRGVMGDHPNTNPLFFGAASDVDVYAITLQAGQILELGNLQGAAVNALLEIADINGGYLLQIDPNTGQRVVIAGLTQLSETSFLVLESGQYFLVVSTDSTTDREPALAGEQPLLVDPNDPGAPLASVRGPIVGHFPQAAPGTLGTYSFTVRISVDGDSGGGDESDSGDGDKIAAIPNASTQAEAPLPAAFPVIADFDGPDNIYGNANDTVPLPAAFRGADLILGNADDPAQLTLGDFRWVYDRGPDGLASGNGAVGAPSDDRIVGKRINPIVGQPNQEIYLLAGVDGRFGTADDQFAVYQNGYLWQRNAGPNNTFDGNGAVGSPSDDIVIGVEAVAVFGATGINTVRIVANPNEQRRTAGADGIFGTADDRTNQAPAPSEFAGPDNILGNGDDLANITRNGIVWTLSAGNNQTFNGNGGAGTPSDDVVIGTQSNGQTRRVTAGFDGVFGTSDDRTNQAPLPSEFAGPDGILGNTDDLQIISRGQYDWILDRGVNNRFDGDAPTRGVSDDIVIGTNRFGSKQILVAGPDGRFGTSDDRITIQSAIGRINNIGAVVDPTGDVDVFKLNGGSVIQSGSRYRITFRISEFGGDPGLNTVRATSDAGGLVSPNALVDRFPAIQFGLFDVSGIYDVNAPAVQQAALLAAPSNSYAFNGVPNTVLASDGITTYGYDEKGDLYMDVLFGGSLLDPTQAGRYAVVVEAPQATGYNVEIRRLADQSQAVAPQTQNILLEIGGGTVEWLEAFGSRQLLGFSGLTQSRVPLLDALNNPINTTVRDYTVANLLANLNAVFEAALGPNVIRFSTSAAAFAGQDFSTIFITDSPETAARAGSGFTGQSQGVDAYNANRNDQAVVFAAPLNVFAGNLPTQAGIDRYTRQLTAAVAFRVGELVGLRQVESPAAGSTPFPVMADNSDTATPGNINNLRFTNAWRPLSQTSGESRFSIGFQNEQALLRRIFQISGA